MTPEPVEILVGSSERNPTILKLGPTSPLPESLGADFLFTTRDGSLGGVQRKTIPDLVSSIRSGRLADELRRLAQITFHAVVIEGEPRWTGDGNLADTFTRFTRGELEGVEFSLQHAGFWVIRATDPYDTVRRITHLAEWLNKSTHTLLDARGGKPRGMWGPPEPKDNLAWIVQGIADIGPVTAAKLVEHLGLRLLAWTVTWEDLMRVPGVGRGTAEALLRALGQEELIPERRTRKVKTHG